MARAIWSGSINFGLVTVPVELYSATEDHTVHFRQFERGTSDRIRYRRVNERTGSEQIAAIRAGDDDVLVLETLLFDEDLRDPAKELRKVSVEAPPSEPTEVVDLFDALSKSVESRKSNRKSSRAKTAPKKRPARKRVS